MFPSVRIFMHQLHPEASGLFRRLAVTACITCTTAVLLAAPASTAVVPTYESLAPTTTTPVAQAASALVAPEVPGVAEATAASALAGVELEAATAALADANQSLAAATAVRVRAHVAFDQARADWARVAAEAGTAGQSRRAAGEVRDLLFAGGLQTVDPVRAVEVGLSVVDQIDPSTDVDAQLDEAEYAAELATRVDAMYTSRLVAAVQRRLAESAELRAAQQAETSAGEAQAAAAERELAARSGKRAADRTLAAAETVEHEAAVARARAEAAALASRSMQRPAIAEVTSPFGMRTHPLTGVYKLHSGTDFSVGDGVARAARAGTVTEVTHDGAYGTMVTISHGEVDGDTVVTRYAHLSQATAAAGDSVAAGDAVGRIGSTGSATGPHLHFEVLVNGEFVDPMTWLDG